MRPTYWTRRPFHLTGAAKNRVSSIGQSKPSPAYGPVATTSSGRPPGCGCRRASAEVRLWRPYRHAAEQGHDPLIRTAMTSCNPMAMNPWTPRRCLGLMCDSGRRPTDGLYRPLWGPRGIVAPPRPRGADIGAGLPAGTRADGDTPGWRREIRTRSEAGRMANRNGPLRSAASPSIPACTVAGAPTSRYAAVQARAGGCGRSAGASSTRTPSRPVSSAGRVPRATG
jgi:hypothetical protein